jgi:DNA-binding NarL/FixJ family response regulator
MGGGVMAESMRAQIDAMLVKMADMHRALHAMNEALSVMNHTIPALKSLEPAYGRISAIAKEVGAVHAVLPEEIMGPSRYAEVVSAREQVVLRAIEEGFSKAAVARALDKDPSSIRSAYGRAVAARERAFAVAPQHEYEGMRHG